MNRDFKGIWIPREIWESNELTLQEKVFYVEIDSLDNGNKGCYANNNYFAKFFGVSTTRVSLIIKQLIDKGFITSQINVKEGNKRMLKTSLRKVKYPIQHKLIHNNIINNTSNNKKSDEDRQKKFLSLFNQLKKEHTGNSRECKVLSKTDKNNLKQLEGYTLKDFKTSIKEMLQNEWAKSTGNQTPTHILRVENFNRYLAAAEQRIKQEGDKEETLEERAERLANETKNQ